MGYNRASQVEKFISFIDGIKTSIRSLMVPLLTHLVSWICSLERCNWIINKWSVMILTHFMLNDLTHWVRVMCICINNIIIIGSDNGLVPGRHQAIISTNAEILLIRTLGINFSKILIDIHTVSFKKMHFKISSTKWRLYLPGLNMLKKHNR